jgi:hypothetical protein
MPIEPTTGLEILGPVNERTSARYTANLVDPQGDAILSLNSLNVEIFDLVSKTSIRPRESVLNTASATFNTGALTVYIEPQDNTVVDQRRDLEDHVVRLDYTFNGGDNEGHHAFVIRVRNLGKLG